MRALAALLMLAAAGASFAETAPPAGLPDFTRITQQYGPAVVNISVSGTRQVSAGGDQGKAVPSSDEGDGDGADPMQLFLRRFQQQFGGSGASMQVPVRGLGSGFIVSEDGLILTNAHVVADAQEVIVKLTDRREFRARVLGSDAKTDIAVLKIAATQLPVVAIGSPAELKVGEWVLAIGSPFGFENSVSAGVVSAKGRALHDGGAVPFLQTDAAINPGNSGGPLFNARGQVVGINSMIYSRSGGYQGLSFAVPIDLALKVQGQIVASGHAAHGWLGVSVQEVDQTLADAFKLMRPMGALVSDVQAGSGGAAAGLRSGDVILQVDGATVNAASDLSLMVTLAAPGQRLALDVWREAQALKLTVWLDDANRPASKTAAERAAAQPAAGLLGLALRPMTAGERGASGTGAGLMVDAVSGASKLAGMLPGDVLLAVNGRPMASVEQARSALAGGQRSLALLVQRGSEKLFVALRSS